MRTQRFWTTALAVCVLATLAVGPSSFAQHREPPKGPPAWGPGPQRGPGQRREGPMPPGPGFSLLSSEMRFGDKVVKGAPYSAQVVIENVQILGDGTHIRRTTNSSVHRDSEGRTRREQSLDFIGPFTSAGEAPLLIFINDPVAGVHYVLHRRERVARRMKLPTAAPPDHERPRHPSEAKTESLGTRTMEGIEVEGTRSTITIPTGQIGNDRPIDITSERWYSPALQVVVMSKHVDPRFGENTYRLTSIDRTEPARSLFEVPADYTVEEGAFPPGPPRRGMKRRGGAWE